VTGKTASPQHGSVIDCGGRWSFVVMKWRIGDCR
jgi:hypothetical protein